MYCFIYSWCVCFRRNVLNFQFPLWCDEYLFSKFDSAKFLRGGVNVLENLTTTVYRQRKFIFVLPPFFLQPKDSQSICNRLINRQ